MENKNNKLPKQGFSRELFRDFNVAEFVITLNSEGDMSVTTYKGDRQDTTKKFESKTETIYSGAGEELNEKWMLEHFGKRCKDYEKDCGTCEAYKFFDYFKNPE